MYSSIPDGRNGYGQHARDRLSAALRRLALLGETDSPVDSRRNRERVSADLLRKLNEDLERVIVDVQEMASSYERLFASAGYASHRGDLLFDLSPIPCLVLDRSSVVIDANAAAARAVNLSRTHLAGRSFHLFVGADRATFLRRLQSVETADPVTRWPVTIRPRERGSFKMTFVAAIAAEDRVLAMLLPADDSGPAIDAPIPDVPAT